MISLDELDYEDYVEVANSILLQVHGVELHVVAAQMGRIENPRSHAA